MLLTMLLAMLAMADEPPAEAGLEAPDCARPVLIVDQPTVTPAQFNDTMRRAQDYVTCMSKEIEARRKLADETFQKAKAAAQSNNEMVAEVNAFVADVKAYQEKHSGE